MATTTTQWILELIDKISAPMRDIAGASKEAASEVDNIGEKAKKSGQSLKDLKPVDIYALSASVKQLSEDFNSLLEPGVEFDSQMKDLSALTGITGTKLTELGDKARKTSAAFGIDASGMVESYKGVLSRLGPDIAKDSEALRVMGVDISYIK